MWRWCFKCVKFTFWEIAGTLYRGYCCTECNSHDPENYPDDQAQKGRPIFDIKAYAIMSYVNLWNS